MPSEDQPRCPFCDYTNVDRYFLLQHVETLHSEGPSPFVATNELDLERMDLNREPERARETSPDYIECQCGEFCLLAEFESHLELHYAERVTFEEPKAHSSNPRSRGRMEDPVATSSLSNVSPSTSRSHLHSNSKHRSHISWGKRVGTIGYSDATRNAGAYRYKKPSENVFSNGPQRLGKAELGPFAYEERMPEWLLKKLERGAPVTLTNHIGADGNLVRVESTANEFHNIIPVLGQLVEQDATVLRAYLCNPNVAHVVKMDREGGFCGYRNIQMLLSYVRASGAEGSEHFQSGIPSILQLQDSIERAWDQGYNSLGRIETGGIRGTRKYIGTPEAQALLQSLKIGCRAEAFNESKNVVTAQLLPSVEEYFLKGSLDLSKKVCRTSLPPMYFQHPGHSLTIIGFERRRTGDCNLLVLDPMFKPSPGIYRVLGTKFRTLEPAKLLKAYRRGDKYLKKYTNFEILKLTATPPTSSGWLG